MSVKRSEIFFEQAGTDLREIFRFGGGLGERETNGRAELLVRDDVGFPEQAFGGGGDVFRVFVKRQLRERNQVEKLAVFGNFRGRRGGNGARRRQGLSVGFGGGKRKGAHRCECKNEFFHENDKNKFPRVPASFDFVGTPSRGVNKIFPRNAKIASTFAGKASTFSAMRARTLFPFPAAQFPHHFFSRKRKFSP